MPQPGGARRPTEPTPQDLIAAHGNLKRVGGQWQGPCPVCGGADRFHINASTGGNGRPLMGCRQCKAPFGDLLEALGFARTAPRTEPERWVWSTADGRAYTQARGSKGKFWEGGLGGRPQADLLFVPDAPAPGALAVAVEGATSAVALRRLGIAAVGFPSNGPSLASLRRFDPATRWAVWPDHDEAGRQQGARNARALAAAGFEVRMVDPLRLRPDAPPKWDARDWATGRAADGAADALEAALGPCGGGKRPESGDPGAAHTPAPPETEEALLAAVLAGGGPCDLTRLEYGRALAKFDGWRADEPTAALVRSRFPRDVARALFDAAPVDADDGPHLLSDAGDDDVEVVARGIAFRGRLGVIHGGPGSGKTTIAAGVIAAVTAGRTWRGQPTVEGGGEVLVLSGEDVPTLKARIDEWGGRAERVHVWPNPTKAKVAATVAAIDPDLVLVDSLQSLAQHHGIDTDKTGAASDLMRPLAKVAAGSRAAWLVIHHEPWDQSVDADKTSSSGATVPRPRNSGEIAAAVDYLLHCAADRDLRVSYLAPGLKVRHGLPVEGGALLLADDGFRDGGEDDFEGGPGNGGGGPAGPTVDSVLDVLADADEPMTASQMRKAAGWKSQAMQRRLRQVLAAGVRAGRIEVVKVERQGRQWDGYRLAAAPETEHGSHCSNRANHAHGSHGSPVQEANRANHAPNHAPEDGEENHAPAAAEAGRPAANAAPVRAADDRPVGMPLGRPSPAVREPVNGARIKGAGGEDRMETLERLARRDASFVKRTGAIRDRLARRVETQALLAQLGWSVVGKADPKSNPLKTGIIDGEVVAALAELETVPALAEWVRAVKGAA